MSREVGKHTHTHTHTHSDHMTSGLRQLILRAAYAPNRDIIVGAGITSFAFRLMPITKDVFEIHRVDGSVCHIHYNKRGQMGAPWVLPPPLYL